MLSIAEHVGCLLSFGNVRVSPGGRAVVEGWLCQPAAHTPSIAIKTSYELPRSGVNGAAGRSLPAQRGREILLVLVINL